MEGSHPHLYNTRWWLIGEGYPTPQTHPPFALEMGLFKYFTSAPLFTGLQFWVLVYVRGVNLHCGTNLAQRCFFIIFFYSTSKHIWVVRMSNGGFSSGFSDEFSGWIMFHVHWSEKITIYDIRKPTVSVDMTVCSLKCEKRYWNSVEIEMPLIEINSWYWK